MGSSYDKLLISLVSKTVSLNLTLCTRSDIMALLTGVLFKGNVTSVLWHYWRGGHQENRKEKRGRREKNLVFFNSFLPRPASPNFIITNLQEHFITWGQLCRTFMNYWPGLNSKDIIEILIIVTANFNLLLPLWQIISFLTQLSRLETYAK